MYPQLEKYISSVNRSFHTISKNRKLLLDDIAEYLNPIVNPKINFICTHNSRRSHLSQVWGQIAADSFNLQVETYSGGTEATAFHPNAIAALRRAGFQINSLEGENPKYEIISSDKNSPMECFSKRYDDAPNPKSGFIAMMTCSEADQECPIVIGAIKKFRLIYDDPKVADNTRYEAAKYDERCRQIAVEMFYLFSKVTIE